MSEKVIYEIKNLVNGKRYIGSTIHKKKRWGKHRRLLDQGNHTNIHLQRAFNRYGEESFEFSVIEEVDEEEGLRDREQFYIDYWNYYASEKLYNEALDAEAPMRGQELTDEHKKKIGKALRGKELSEEHKKELSRNHADFSGKNHPMYGKHLSKEHRKKLSEANSGENNFMYGKTGKDNPFYGKKHTEETRKKMSENHADVNGKNNSMYGKTDEDAPIYGKTGEDAPANKLTEKKVKIIKYLLKDSGFTQRQMGKMFGVGQVAISRIKRGKTWSNISIN